MTASSTVDKFLKGLIGKNKVNPLNLIYQRFFQAFEDHGVAVSQIPRLLPQIKLSNLKSEDALLQVLKTRQKQGTGPELRILSMNIFCFVI